MTRSNSSRNRRVGIEEEQEQEVKQSPELVFSRMISNDSDYSSDGSLLYQWDGAVWRPVDPRDTENEAFVWLGSGEFADRATPKVAASCAVAALITAKRLPKFEDDSKVILPVNNGYLHVDFGKGELSLKPPEKKYGLTYSVECDFDTKAKSPEFGKFIREILPDEDVRGYVQEYAGYTLMPDTRFQTAMWWLGSGSNGKSTLVEILASLHSRISTVSLDNLDGFALVSLIGASMVWVDETPKRLNEQRLKTLISGGPTQIDRKHKEPINMRPFAKWIMCGNDLPIITDQTHGFWRRFAVVQFERLFTDAEKDVMLAKRITQNELSGVLNWALTGLLRLTQRGRFPAVPALMQDAVESGKREANNVLAWWQDGRAEICDDFITSRNAIYTDYRMYAQMTGTSPLGEEKFWRRVKQLALGIDPKGKQKKVNGKPIRYMNMRLTDPTSALSAELV